MLFKVTRIVGLNVRDANINYNSVSFFLMGYYVAENVAVGYVDVLG